MLAWVFLKRAPDGVYKNSMLNVLTLKRELRCLRHKIHIGLFSAFALSSLNWILTNSSVEELVSLILANSLLEELVSTYPEYSPSIYISSRTGPLFLYYLGSTPLLSLGKLVCISLTNFPDIPQTVFFPASESYRPDNFPKPGSTSRPL